MFRTFVCNLLFGISAVVRIVRSSLRVISLRIEHWRTYIMLLYIPLCCSTIAYRSTLSLKKWLWGAESNIFIESTIHTYQENSIHRNTHATHAHTRVVRLREGFIIFFSFFLHLLLLGSSLTSLHVRMMLKLVAHSLSSTGFITRWWAFFCFPSTALTAPHDSAASAIDEKKKHRFGGAQILFFVRLLFRIFALCSFVVVLFEA